MRRLAALLAAVAAMPVAATAQQEPTDPGMIYDRARAVWRAQERPRLLQYAIVLRYTTDGHPTTLTHDALWDRETGRISVKSISREEQANPHKPHGTNWFGANPEFFEPFGVPELSPMYSFGLAARARAATAPLETPAPDGPKQIGSITIVARDYRVSLAGVETCDDRSEAYHLGLEPRQKPKNYPLRDMWVRNGDFTTCKLRVASNFAQSPSGRGPWEIRFVQSPAGTIIQDEHPLSTIVFRGTEVRDASISFTEVHSVRPNVHTDLWSLGISSTQGDVTREPEEP